MSVKMLDFRIKQNLNFCFSPSSLLIYFVLHTIFADVCFFFNGKFMFL